MHVVIFGLTVTSSWGNGHATLWRGLLKAMARRGHTVVFYERDVSWYADTRDGWQPPAGVTIRLYREWADIATEALRHANDSGLALFTSYCADGPAAARLILDSHAGMKAFYDMDTPVTLEALRSGAGVAYLPAEGLRDFDLVLSYTGGRALDELQSRLGAKRVAPLYGSVDPEAHYPVPSVDNFRATLSYLGTYAEDRQDGVAELFLKPALALPEERFLVGGAQYPAEFPWSANVYFTQHLPPSLHPAFYCSGRATLNVTRRAMKENGWCPSGRLFEAAACGVPLLSDVWEGLDSFFVPGEEILPVRTCQDVLDALSLSDDALARICDAARQRVLRDHTAAQRVKNLERVCVAHVS